MVGTFFGGLENESDGLEAFSRSLRVWNTTPVQARIRDHRMDIKMANVMRAINAVIVIPFIRIRTPVIVLSNSNGGQKPHGTRFSMPLVVASWLSSCTFSIFGFRDLLVLYVV